MVREAEYEEKIILKETGYNLYNSCTNLYKKIMQTEAGSLWKKICEIIENLDTGFCLWFQVQSLKTLAVSK